MTETQVQKSILEWCAYALRKDVVYWSVPNERDPRNNLGGMRALGLKTGVSDLMFLRGGNIIFIEVKRPTTYKRGKRGKPVIGQRGGELSTSQEEFKNAVTAAGSLYYMVDNLPDFQQIMQNLGYAR